MGLWKLYCFRRPFYFLRRCRRVATKETLLLWVCGGFIVSADLFISCRVATFFEKSLAPATPEEYWVCGDFIVSADFFCYLPSYSKYAISHNKGGKSKRGEHPFLSFEGWGYIGGGGSKPLPPIRLLSYSFLAARKS